MYRNFEILLETTLASQDLVQLYLEALNNQDLMRLSNMVKGYMKKLPPDTVAKLLSRQARLSLDHMILKTFKETFPEMDYDDARSAAETLSGEVAKFEPGEEAIDMVNVAVPILYKGKPIKKMVFLINRKDFKKFTDWYSKNIPQIQKMKPGMVDVPGIGQVKVSIHHAPEKTNVYDPFSRGTGYYTKVPAQFDDIIAGLENP